MKEEKPKQIKRKSNAPVNTGHKSTQKGASGVPNSTGGSRQGNIGHQGGGPNDNSHR